ncbi:MAG: hypothetical protein M1497_15800 [Nitrospirae bacterium]|nr:hypothetical protein [Nitrospirota bacterium]
MATEKLVVVAPSCHGKGPSSPRPDTPGIQNGPSGDFAAGQSDDEVFRGIEYHGSAVGDEEMTRFETMVLEEKRPG